MIRPQAPRLLIPCTPPMPASPIRRPQIWNLKPLFDPDVRSPNRMLRCLCAEIRPERDGSLVVLLDLKYYELSPSPNSCIKLLLGNAGVTTFVEAADCGDGTTIVSGVLPIATLKEGVLVTLDVLTDNIIRDQLTIGIVQVISVQSAAELRRGRALPIFTPMVDPLAPCATADAEKEENPECLHEVPMEDEESMLPKESIPPDYQRLWLRFMDDVDSMTKDWTATEDTAGRRLVRFWREQVGSLVKIRFAMHPPLDRFNEKVHMLISCIKLPDREGHFVTSFDIVKLAEFVLDLSLNTDMKNRARRNMASVDCETLPRHAGNEGSKAEAFNFLMRFGDPKPRSIEKSIKVYAWNCLEQCLSKILQRFIIHLPDIPTGPTEFEHQLEAVSKWKKSQRSEAMSTRPTKTRRESRMQAYGRQADPRVRPFARIARAPTSQLEWRRASPKAESVEPSIKQEEDTSPAILQEESKEAHQDQMEPSPVGIQTRQALRLQTAEAPLAATPSPTHAPSPPTQVTQESSPSPPPHPPLQRESSSNSLTVPHHGWTNASASDCGSGVTLPSPAETFGSSLASYSPAQSNSSGPGFYFFDSAAGPQQPRTHDIPSVSSSSSSGYCISPGTSHQGMSTSSTIFTPTWPSHPQLGVYVHPSMVDPGYCKQSPVECPPSDTELQRSSHPGTPSLIPGGPVLAGGISIDPRYALYELERAQMLLIQMDMQGHPLGHQPKEDFKDIDTDEWLDNDYIMAQENNHDG